MKILYVFTAYCPRVGGVKYVVKSIAERPGERGHDFTVIAGEPEAEESHEEEVNEGRVFRWPTLFPGSVYHLPRQRNKLETLLESEPWDADVDHVLSVYSLLSVWSGLKAKEVGYKGELIVIPYYHGTVHTIIRRTFWIPWRGSSEDLLLVEYF